MRCSNSVPAILPCGILIAMNRSTWMHWITGTKHVFHGVRPHLIIKIRGIQENNFEIEKILWICYNAKTVQVFHVLARNKAAGPATTARWSLSACGLAATCKHCTWHEQLVPARLDKAVLSTATKMPHVTWWVKSFGVAVSCIDLL